MQRIGLAQALIGQPDLVFLDEPTSGLDPLGRLLVRDVLRELRDRGTTVFLNSHLLGEVEATCSRVAFVKEGRTVHDMSVGETDGKLDVEVRSGPVPDATRGALAQLGRVLDDGLMEPASGIARSRLRISVDGEEHVPEIARTLVERGVPVYEIRVTRQSLEARFLEVMGEDQRPG